MANYDNLISAIKASIKPNGTQAITGQVLQDTLLSMVSQLGKNCAFGGVATPSTNPSTPTINTFYIATEAGTYTKMGGLVLADGEVAILSWNGTSWQKHTIDVVNESAINGGAYDISLFGKEAGAYNTGGTISWASSGFYRTNPIALRAGDEVSVTTTSTVNVSVFSEVDEAGNYVFTLMNGVNSGSTTFTYKADRDIRLVVSFVQQVGHIRRTGLISSVNRTLNLVAGNISPISGFGKIDGYYKVDGSFSSQSGLYHTAPIHLNAMDIVSVTTKSTSTMSVISKVTEEGSYISTLIQGVDSNSSTFEYEATEECYVVVSFINSEGYVEYRDIRSALNRVASADNRRVTMLAIGDSLTAAGKWQIEVGKIINADVRTHALGGIGIVSMVDGIDTLPALSPSDVEDVDIVCLFGAFNAYRTALDNLGVTTDMYPDQPTFIGQLNYALKRIYECAKEVGNDDLRVVLISPYNFGGGSYCGDTGLTAGVKMLDGFEKASLRHSAQLIDLLHNGQIAEHNWDVYCAGAGTINTTYLAYDSRKPYGEVSKFPNTSLIPSDNKKEVNIVNCGINDGGWRYGDGAFYWIGSFFHTNPILLKAGETVSITTASTENVAVFVEVLEDGTYVKDLTRGVDKRTYTYTAQETMYVSVSFVQQDGYVSILPNSTLINGMLALVASDNSYGYTYSEWNNGSWTHNITPWSGAKYPPYAYLWRDYIHLNDEGHKRIAKYIASQLKPIK